MDVGCGTGRYSNILAKKKDYVLSHHRSHGYYLAKQSPVEKMISEFYDSDSKSKPILFTGFNRRFSPFSNEIRNFTSERINPLFITYINIKFKKITLCMPVEPERLRRLQRPK